MSTTSRKGIVERNIKSIAGKELKSAELVAKRHYCKNCGGSNVVKNGMDAKRQQRYKCKDCSTRFVETQSFKGMRTNYRMIATGIEMYMEGMSFRQVARMLRKIYGEEVSHVTVYNWVKKYVPLVDGFARTLKPGTSGDWCTDETMVLVRKKGCNRETTGRKRSYHEWLWSVMDQSTKYILGFHYSETRTMKDIITNFADARDTANGRPETFVSDAVQGYERALKKVFGYRSLPDHCKGPGIKGVRRNDRAKVHNNTMERFWGEIKDRTASMRGMVNGETIAKGLVLHHNLLRPHSSLGGHTPLEASGVHLPLTNGWGDLIQFSYIHRAAESERRRKKFGATPSRNN